VAASGLVALLAHRYSVQHFVATYPHRCRQQLCDTLSSPPWLLPSLVPGMDPEASRTARESLDLAFQMSNILDTGLDRHTLSVLIALCDLGVNPESLAALVKELRNEKPSLSSATAPSSSSFSFDVILFLLRYIDD
ncbi:hypothetical protein HN873_066235, partial [Arachis hypogaea]